MAKCFRHFKALVRKNVKIWYRNKGCLVFEFVAPLVLMIALAVIRAQVPVTYTD